LEAGLVSDAGVVLDVARVVPASAKPGAGAVPHGARVEPAGLVADAGVVLDTARVAGAGVKKLADAGALAHMLREGGGTGKEKRQGGRHDENESAHAGPPIEL
jgi:hypothetical protein